MKWRFKDSLTHCRLCGKELAPHKRWYCTSQCSWQYRAELKKQSMTTHTRKTALFAPMKCIKCSKEIKLGEQYTATSGAGSERHKQC